MAVSVVWNVLHTRHTYLPGGTKRTINNHTPNKTNKAGAAQKNKKYKHARQGSRRAPPGNITQESSMFYFPKRPPPHPKKKKKKKKRKPPGNFHREMHCMHAGTHRLKGAAIWRMVLYVFKQCTGRPTTKPGCAAGPHKLILHSPVLILM